MVRRRAADVRTVRSFTPDLQSQWHLVPKDILSKVFAQSSSLSCIARQVCKAWQQHSISCPVTLDISLASIDEQTSLGLWLHSHEAGPSASATAKFAGNFSATSDEKVARDQQALAALLTATSSLGSPNISQANTHSFVTRACGQAEAVVPDHEPAVVQHISSLKLNMWLDFKIIQDLLAELTLSFMKLWAGLRVAHVSELTLGEFLSNVFCHVSSGMLSLPRFSAASGLHNLQSLTLHLNAYCMHDVFRPDGCLAALSMLTVLKSFTLKASEVDVNGHRKKQQVPADRLLDSLPASIQSLSLENFRDRWQGFSDLSGKPSLVSLDLTQSSCIFPTDSQAWIQLQHLKLRKSIVWLQEGHMFLFRELTHLTQLDLGDCYFGSVSPGQIHNTHHCVYQQIQVPASIVSLNLCTRSIRRLLVKDKLTALTSLWLHNACEVLDDKAPLQSLLGLQVTFDTLNKAYHGEWWTHLKRLYTKSPCNVPLGVAGHLPEGLEFLCLHTCCPEPLTVSTGVMTTQPKAYPHRAVPGPPLPNQARPFPKGRYSRRAKAEDSAKLKGQGRPLTMRAAALCSVLPVLHTLELYFTGSLRELTLTGLPQLQHLKVTQQLPRSESSVTVKCKALRLPYSLLSFHLTVSTPSMDLGEQLSVLANLPRLESVGLHGPLLEKIPALPASVTSLDLSDSWLVDQRSYRQLSLMTHLKELVLPHPLPKTDSPGCAESSDSVFCTAQILQTTLKRHHVQLRYKDSDPFMPSTGGTCLHPCPPPAAELAHPPQQAAAPGLGSDWMAQYLEQLNEGGGDIDNDGNAADFDDGWQQALWADAHAVYHAAEVAH